MLKNKLSISTRQTMSSFVYSDTLETTGTISSPKLDGEFIVERPDLIYKTDILKQVIKNTLLSRESRKLHLEIEHFPGFYPYHAHYKNTSDQELSEERKGGQIVSISKTKLIEKVANEFQQNSSLYSVLLYTYEWYLDEKELFTGLLRQFKKSLPIGMSVIENNVFLVSIISKTQIKILAFLKDWFREYKNKFHNDSTLEEMLLELLFLMLTHPHTGEWIRQPIVQLISDLGGLESQKSLVGSRPVMKFTALPEIFIPFSAFVGYAHLLAKQLCIVDLENLKKVHPSEFKNRIWTKNDKHILAPNLTYIAEMSTRLSRFTSYLILMNKQRMQRALLFQYLIDLCDQLVSLKNYNSAFAIYLGLSSPAIQKHKETLENHLPKVHKDVFQTLEELFSSSNNMATLRKKQEELEAPAMPFLGIHLSDIFFAEELPDYVDKEKIMINFNKFRVISNKINRLLSYKEPYGFHRVDSIINFIKGIPFISEEHIYALSDYV